MPNTHDIRNCRKCFYLRVVAIVIWTCGLATLSLWPQIKIQQIITAQDKLFHFLAYLLTAWLAARLLQVLSFSIIKSTVISFIYSIFLGVLLECLQHAMTRTRTAEWYDVLANIAGAICGCVIFCLQGKLSSE